MSDWFNHLVDRRPYIARGVASALFALTALCFALPFVRAVSDVRQGHASGVDLITGDAALSGYYVHDAYRGEVEAFLDRGQVPAMVVVAAMLAGIVAAWVPWRAGAATAFVLATVGLVGLGALYVAVSNQYEPSVQDWRYGFWFAVLVATAGVSWTLQILRATPFWWGLPDSPRRDYFAPSEQRD